MSDAPLARDAPPRIELGAAAITAQRSTIVTQLSLWVSGLAIIATTFMKQAWPAYKVSIEEPIPGMKWSVYNRIQTIQPNFALLQALGVAVAALFCVAVVSYFATREQRSYGGMRVEGDVLVLVYSDKPERRIPIADIVSMEATASSTVLELENGTRIELTSQAGRELASELQKRRSKLDRTRISRGVLEQALGGRLLKALPWLGFFSLLGGWEQAGRAFNAGSYMGVVVLAVLTAAWLAVGVWHARPARISIGADGVRLSGRGRPRFIPFADVREIDTSGKISLRLRDGSTVVVGADERGLGTRLKEALASYREPGSASPTQHERVLRRGERSPEDWRAELSKLAHTLDYRADVLDEEALANVVGDPRIDPEQRVAAALALSKSDESRARIRIAAQRSADEDVQRALEAAALDELAEDELARAMRRRG